MSIRISRVGQFIVAAEPSVVFPLLCPVQEKKWVPGWEYDMIFSQSGFAELGCVFTTPHSSGNQKHETWIVTQYQPMSVIEYVRTDNENLVCHIYIELKKTHSQTELCVRYTYTALNSVGKDFINNTFTEDYYQSYIEEWEQLLNGYIA